MLFNSACTFATLKVFNGGVFGAAFERDAENPLQIAQMLRPLSCEEASEGMNRGQSCIAGGDPVVALNLKKIEKADDSLGANVRDIERLNRAMGIVTNRISKTKASR